MITEDYVGFKTAKLLKEKGFNEVTPKWYELYRGKYELVSRGTSMHAEGSIDVPTLQMACKWLRENFQLNPVPYALSLGWSFDIFDLSNRDITGCKKIYSMDIPSKSNCYKSYEQACDSAIRYCLENLI